MNRKLMSMLLALFLALSAVSAVSGDGSDPNDPSDGGADWDGDGLTNAEEQQQGTDMTRADSDGDGLQMDGRSITALTRILVATLTQIQTVMV